MARKTVPKVNWETPSKPCWIKLISFKGDEVASVEALVKQLTVLEEETTDEQGDGAQGLPPAENVLQSREEEKARIVPLLLEALKQLRSSRRSSKARL